MYVRDVPLAAATDEVNKELVRLAWNKGPVSEATVWEHYRNLPESQRSAPFKHIVNHVASMVTTGESMRLPGGGVLSRLKGKQKKDDQSHITPFLIDEPSGPPATPGAGSSRTAGGQSAQKRDDQSHITPFPLYEPSGPSATPGAGSSRTAGGQSAPPPVRSSRTDTPGPAGQQRSRRPVAVSPRVSAIRSTVRVLSLDGGRTSGVNWTGGGIGDLATGRVLSRWTDGAVRSDRAPWQRTPFVLLANQGDHRGVDVPWPDGSRRRITAEELADFLAVEMEGHPADRSIVLAWPHSGDQGLDVPRLVAQRTGRRVWSYSSVVAVDRDAQGYLFLTGIEQKEGGLGDWVPSDPGELAGPRSGDGPEWWEPLWSSRAIVTPGHQRIGRLSYLPEELTESWLNERRNVLSMRQQLNVHPISNTVVGRPEPMPEVDYFYYGHGVPNKIMVPLTDGREIEVSGPSFARALARRASVSNLARRSEASVRGGGKRLSLFFSPCYGAAVSDLPSKVATRTAPAPFALDPLATASPAQHVANETGLVVHAGDRLGGISTSFDRLQITDLQGTGAFHKLRPEPNPRELDDLARSVGLHQGPGRVPDADRDAALRLVRALRRVFGDDVDDQPDYPHLLAAIGSVELMRRADRLLSAAAPHFTMDLLDRVVRADQSVPSPIELQRRDYRDTLVRAESAWRRRPRSLSSFVTLPPEVVWVAQLPVSDSSVRNTLGVPAGEPLRSTHYSKYFWVRVATEEVFASQRDTGAFEAGILHLTAPDPNASPVARHWVAWALARGYDPSNTDALATAHLVGVGLTGPGTKLTGKARGRNYAGLALSGDVDATVVRVSPTAGVPAPWTSPVGTVPLVVTVGTPTDGRAGRGRVELTGPDGRRHVVPEGQLVELLVRDSAIFQQSHEVPLVLAMPWAGRISPDLPGTLADRLGRTVWFTDGSIGWSGLGGWGPAMIDTTVPGTQEWRSIAPGGRRSSPAAMGTSSRTAFVQRTDGPQGRWVRALEAWQHDLSTWVDPSPDSSFSRALTRLSESGHPVDPDSAEAVAFVARELQNHPDPAFLRAPQILGTTRADSTDIHQDAVAKGLGKTSRSAPGPAGPDADAEPPTTATATADAREIVHLGSQSAHDAWHALESEDGGEDKARDILAGVDRLFPGREGEMHDAAKRAYAALTARERTLGARAIAQLLQNQMTTGTRYPVKGGAPTARSSHAGTGGDRTQRPGPSQSRGVQGMPTEVEVLNSLWARDPDLREAPPDLGLLARRILHLPENARVGSSVRSELSRLVQDAYTRGRATSVAALAAHHIRTWTDSARPVLTLDGRTATGVNWTGMVLGDLNTSRVWQTSTDGARTRTRAPWRGTPLVVAAADGDHTGVQVPWPDGSRRRMTAEEIAEYLAVEVARQPADRSIVLAWPFSGDQSLYLPRLVARRTGRRVWSYTSVVRVERDSRGAYLTGVEQTPAGFGDWGFSDPDHLVDPRPGDRPEWWEPLWSTRSIVNPDSQRIGRVSLPPDDLTKKRLRELRHLEEFQVRVNLHPVTRAQVGVASPALEGQYYYYAHGRPGAVDVPLLDGRSIQVSGASFARALARRPSVRRLTDASNASVRGGGKRLSLYFAPCFGAAASDLPSDWSSNAAPAPFVLDPLENISTAQHVANQTRLIVPTGGNRAVAAWEPRGDGTFVHVLYTDVRGNPGQSPTLYPEPTRETLDNQARLAGLHNGPGQVSDQDRDATLRLVRALRRIFGDDVDERADYPALLTAIGSVELMRRADRNLAAAPLFTMDLLERVVRADRSVPSPTRLRRRDYEGTLMHAASAWKHGRRPLSSFVALPPEVVRVAQLPPAPDSDVRETLGLLPIQSVMSTHRSKYFWVRVATEEVFSRQRRSDERAFIARILHSSYLGPDAPLAARHAVAWALARGFDPFNVDALAAASLIRNSGLQAANTMLTGPSGGRNYAPVDFSGGIDATGLRLSRTQTMPAPWLPSSGTGISSLHDTPPAVVTLGSPSVGARAREWVELTGPDGRRHVVPEDELVELLAWDSDIFRLPLEIPLVLAMSRTGTTNPDLPGKLADRLGRTVWYPEGTVGWSGLGGPHPALIDLTVPGSGAWRWIAPGARQARPAATRPGSVYASAQALDGPPQRWAHALNDHQHDLGLWADESPDSPFSRALTRLSDAGRAVDPDSAEAVAFVARELRNHPDPAFVRAPQVLGTTRADRTDIHQNAVSKGLGKVAESAADESVADESPAGRVAGPGLRASGVPVRSESAVEDFRRAWVSAGKKTSGDELGALGDALAGAQRLAAPFLSEPFGVVARIEEHEGDFDALDSELRDVVVVADHLRRNPGDESGAAELTAELARVRGAERRPSLPGGAPAPAPIRTGGGVRPDGGPVASSSGSAGVLDGGSEDGLVSSPVGSPDAVDGATVRARWDAALNPGRQRAGHHPPAADPVPETVRRSAESARDAEGAPDPVMADVRIEPGPKPVRSLSDDQAGAESTDPEAAVSLKERFRDALSGVPETTGGSPAQTTGS
jgi:hypothetical protein